MCFQALFVEEIVWEVYISSKRCSSVWSVCFHTAALSSCAHLKASRQHTQRRRYLRLRRVKASTRFSGGKGDCNELFWNSLDNCSLFNNRLSFRVKLLRDKPSSALTAQALKSFSTFKLWFHCICSACIVLLLLLIPHIQRLKYTSFLYGYSSKPYKACCIIFDSNMIKTWWKNCRYSMHSVIWMSIYSYFLAK